MWSIVLSRQAAQFLESLTGKHRRQMENGLAVLERDPTQGKPLKGELKNYWSLRVGVYRIIYTIRHTEIVVEILRIHHRKEVYERFRR